MGQVIVEFLLDDRRWLFTSMLLSTIAVVVSLADDACTACLHRLEILWAMNLFYGCMIGTMALGHLTAVTVKTVQGTLEGSLWMLYPLGLALAIPAWWLAFRAERYVTREDRYSKQDSRAQFVVGRLPRRSRFAQSAAGGTRRLEYRLPVSPQASGGMDDRDGGDRREPRAVCRIDYFPRQRSEFRAVPGYEVRRSDHA